MQTLVCTFRKPPDNPRGRASATCRRVNLVDNVDNVAILIMKSRKKTMTTVLQTAKTELTLKNFLDKAKALNGSAGRLKKVIKTRGLVQRRKRAYVQQLLRLERSIHELAVEIDDEHQIAGAKPAEQAQAKKVPDQPASVRTKLDSMIQHRQLLASAEFVEELGWTRQALSKALAANRVFYVDFKGDRYFPAFFADPAYQRSKLEAVSKVLGELPGGAKLQFFLGPRGSLAGETVLTALSQGKLQKVKALAEDFAQGR